MSNSIEAFDITPAFEAWENYPSNKVTQEFYDALNDALSRGCVPKLQGTIWNGMNREGVIILCIMDDGTLFIQIVIYQDLRVQMKQYDILEDVAFKTDIKALENRVLALEQKA